MLSSSLAIRGPGRSDEYEFNHRIQAFDCCVSRTLWRRSGDGSEYRGNYGLTVEELMSFHRERMGVLLETGADLLACETIPCPEEAMALMALLKEFPDAKAWISFSCKNDMQLCDGTDFQRCAAMTNDSDQVVAVGINCTAPQFVKSLIQRATPVCHKPIFVYPNKGETWDAVNKCWIPGTGQPDFVESALGWLEAGASGIGGCCRTTPEDILHLKKMVHKKIKE